MDTPARGTTRVVSLFSGIEGFGLGLELAGAAPEILVQVEIDPFCQRILRARYPDARLVSDVRDLVEPPEAPVEVLTLGFPCQPVSQAGKRKAQEDERWLWPEAKRVIRLLGPRFVLIENVRGLRSAGLADVLTDLADLAYHAQWDLVPAAAVGAPHLRHRFWIVAYRPDDPVGRIFDGPPPVFRWADEEEAKPRLARDVAERRGRLTALGNAVVPHNVAYVWLALQRALARGDDPVAGRVGFRVPLWDPLPYAGALADGKVYDLGTCVPKINGRLWPTATVRGEERLWPTPKASPSGPDYARAGREESGGDDLATAVARDNAAIPGGGLNPRWVEWLMGYPGGWTDPEHVTATAAEKAA